MKKFLSNVAKVGAGIIIGSSMTAFAATTLVYNVYSNDGIKIKINGVVQELRDAATGEREYPLTYKNRTYIPLRSVATLLGYNVDYEQDTNTAIVNSPNYVPVVTSSPRTTQAPVQTPSSQKLAANDIDVVKNLYWRDPPLTDSSSVLSAASVSVVVNGLYQELDSAYISNYIHPSTPLRQDLLDHIAYWRAIEDRYNAQNGTLSMYCNSSNVKFLKYGYDSSGKCRGCIATYTLEWTYGFGGNMQKENETLTSIFIYKDDSRFNLTWVADITGTLGFNSATTAPVKTSTPVRTSTPITQAPVQTVAPVSNSKPTLGTLNSSNIGVISRLNWKNPPQTDSSCMITTTKVDIVVDDLFNFIGNGITPTGTVIHPDTPLRSQAQEDLGSLLALRKQYASAGGNVLVAVDHSATQILRYGYDSSGVCRGVVAKYRLNVTYSQGGQMKKESFDYTSIFVYAEDIRLNLAWVGNIVG